MTDVVLPSVINLPLTVEVDEENGELTLSHKSLSGELKLRFTSLDLANIQLQALRSDKTQSFVESMSTDVAELMRLSHELRAELLNLKEW